MEKVFNGLPSKKEYIEGVASFLMNNSYAFEKEEDSSSSSIGMLYDSGEMYQLSYETDELAPYLANGKHNFVLKANKYQPAGKELIVQGPHQKFKFTLVPNKHFKYKSKLK